MKYLHFPGLSLFKTQLYKYLASKSFVRNITGPLETRVTGIEGKIPSQASTTNQLADKAFVNSSISTNTGEFKGTYDSLQALETAAWDANANDYGFVRSVDGQGNTVFDRYKFVPGVVRGNWVYEYTLNNSSFTSEQWGTINSGFTDSDKEKLDDLPDSDGLDDMLDAKQDKLTFDVEPTQYSSNPVRSNGVKAYTDNSLVFDISVNFPDEGVDDQGQPGGDRYELTSETLGKVPGKYRRGNLKVSFIGLDGYYKEYRNTSGSWTTVVSAWQGVDTEMSDVSPNPVQNSTIKNYVDNGLALGAVYDVSAYNDNAKFASLEALLSNENLDTLIPTSVRKGGMTIRFVQSSDNKYVQYRLTKDEFSVIESDWVEDNIVNVKAIHSDFSIMDEKKNAIVCFSDGEIKTKNFDSRDYKTRESICDFEISDENKKSVVVFSEGNIKTKSFDSKYIHSSVFSKYAGKKLSILGDSISTYGVPDAANQDGTYCYSYYPNATCRYSRDGGGEGGSIAFDVNDMYWMKLLKATGMVLGVNESWRGTFISGSLSSALNNQTRINHLGENGNPDVILIYGGTNDVGNGREVGTFNTDNPENYTQEQIANLPVNTFADGFRTMLIRVMKKYPNAEVVVILPTFVVLYSQTPDYNEVLDNYLEVIKEACDFFGIKYIDARCTGITLFNKQNYIVSDGVHPNKLGMDLLYKKIYKHLIFE